MNKLSALKEAVADTVFATIINIPINFGMAYIAVKYSWTPLEITVYFTAVFCVIAIYRKYRMRLYFAARQ